MPASRARTARGGRSRRCRGGLAAALLALSAAACVPPPATDHDGPVVVVTLGGLRADVTGYLGGTPSGLTPHLDALAVRAEWADAAVAPSSVGLVSLASYSTGLGAWAHGVGFGERPLELAGELRTLGEVLAERGFRSAGYVPAWIVRAGGWQEGFGFLRDIAGGGRAAGHLASLEGGRDFLWIHLAGAEAPFTRRDAFLDRLELPPDRLAALPESLSQAELEVLRNPAAQVERETLRTAAEALYRSSVAAVDQQLGELVAALEASGQRERTLLVVASTHGQELATPTSWGLAREHIEVPLIVDLPAAGAGGRQLASSPGERPPAAALWATIAETVGAAIAPATEPSLFTASTGALSELYLGDGVNETSWVEGDLQLLRRARFSPAADQFHLVRLARVNAAPGWLENPGQVLARFEETFASMPAWAGQGPAESILLAWHSGGSTAVGEPERQAALARRMSRARLAFTPCDETPRAAEARRDAEAAAAGDG